MKLFKVDIMDDCEQETEIRVGNSKEDVEKKILEENEYACLMWVNAIEITEIDNYAVILKKIGE